jgi:hypothetical protein
LLDPFSIQYFDGSTASGRFFADTLTIGSATLENVTMAVATSTSDRSYGILGIGLDGLKTRGARYSNIIDVLQSQGVTSSRSYSVYLDDIDSATGELLLGGGDASKYTGSLVRFPIVQSPDGAARLSVQWDSLRVTGGAGISTTIPTAALPYPAVLDTGYTLAVLPVGPPRSGRGRGRTARTSSTAPRAPAPSTSASAA